MYNFKSLFVMDNYNQNNVNEYFISFLKRKLLDTISLMIINKKTSETFPYISDIKKFSYIFEYVAEYFNCDINFITTKINDSKVTYECVLSINPSNKHSVTFIESTYKPNYTPFGLDDDW